MRSGTEICMWVCANHWLVFGQRQEQEPALEPEPGVVPFTQ